MRFETSVACGVALGIASLATPAHADEPRPVFIWYRSGGECPDGAAFLSKLADKVPDPRIAAAGDPIDFVVTLGSLGKRSNGRLERETTEGKVAIREIDSADALALSLALAIDPNKKPADPAPASTTSPAPPDTSDPRVRPSPADPKRDRSPTQRRESSSWWIGGQASLASAIAPSPLPGGFLFVELDRAHASVLPGSSLRFGALARFGTVMTNVGDVRHRLLAGRAEACPFRIGSDTLAAKPCAGFDLGQLQVEGNDSESGVTDSALWAAVGLNARLAWRAVGSLSFEVDLGAFAPLTRYTLRTSDPNLEGERTDLVGFSAGLGASVLLP